MKIPALKVPLLLVLGWCGAAAHAATWSENPAEALAEARRSGQPVLVDFYAPWCYSCYFMDQHVLETAEFEKRAGRLILLKVDVDSAAGALEQTRRNVSFLPTYLLLDANGTELDRLPGEQTPADFFVWLDRHLESGPRGAPQGPEEVIAALLADVRRGSFQAGLSWFGGLDPELQVAVQERPAGMTALARLRLARAAHAAESAQCLTQLSRALRHAPICAKSSVVYDGRGCEAPATPAQRQVWDEIVAGHMLQVVEAGVLVPFAQRCADARSPVLMSTASLRRLARGPEARVVLDRVIRQAREELGEDVAGNRNLADNLRIFLADAGRNEELMELYPQLMSAYPQDYVYAFRYARALADQGRHAEALAPFAAAGAQAYGENRLRIASKHADSLVELGQVVAAKAVLVAALKANGRWFPAQAGELRAQLSALRD